MSTCPAVRLEPLDKAAVTWAQLQVTAYHYLRRPVDPRCSVEGYAIYVPGVPEPVGCLLFGRPQATRAYPWYSSVLDVETGRAECTRWQVLNLARVWLAPTVQRGGIYHNAHHGHVPGFYDRHGTFRSTLASDALKAALDRVGFDYLLRRPPVFPDQPYHVRWLLSYCDTRLHKGTIYRAAGFDLYHTNEAGIQTWRIRLPLLTAAQHRAILARSAADRRAIRYRARRSQLHLPALEQTQ